MGLLGSTLTGKSSTGSKNERRTLGIVAGEGKLPGLLAKSAAAKGWRVVAVTLSPNAQAQVMPHVEAVHLIAPGQLGRNLKLLKEENVDSLVFIGKMPKIDLLKNIHKLDWLGIQTLSKMANFSDDSIQQTMGQVTEEHGMKVLTQSEFLRELFPNYGVMTKRQPTVGEYADVEYGIGVARELARLDIGQTVVVRDQMIIALEAIDGTDSTIRRAVSIAGKPVVVCKVARPSQDQRFDIPTVGMATLQSMVAPTPGGVLALGAGETMVVDKEEMVEFAEKHGMVMMAV